MRLCVVGKFPPIQGGVSRETYWDCHALASMGHRVDVITNANEVEASFKIQEEFYADQQSGHAPRTGCAVRVHHTGTDPALLRYIPFSNPYVSKLAGKATEVMEEDGPFDLIYGYYLEPYGVAAQLASAWTEVPFGLRHAGSDITRLFRHDGLRKTYQRIASRADFWLAPTLTRRGLHHLGVPYDKIYFPAAPSLPAEFFHQHATPLDMALLDERTRVNRIPGLPEPPPRPTFDPEVPTIGSYGKVGEKKGTYDLLRAFAIARKKAGKANLVIVSSGPEANLRLVGKLARDLSIDDCLTVLPFMPPWQVPSFITACDAVAFLERDFPIAVHRPFVPREILACGGCLILSREVAAYQTYAEQLHDGSNCLLVDPCDHTELAAALSLVVEAPARARDIGTLGRIQVSQGLEDWGTHVSEISETFSRIASEVESRRIAVTVADTQAALARLYVDEAFRGWFAHAPDDALRKYSLTDPEKDMLKAIDQQMVELFAESLRQKRREPMLKSFPLTSKACGTDLFLHYFDRYCDLHPAQPNVEFTDQVAPFGRYLAECLAVEPSVPPYAAEVGRYEATLAERRFTVLPSDDLMLITSASGVTAAKAGYSLDDRPVLTDNVSVLRFAYEIPRILADIERDSMEDGYPKKATVLILRSVPQAPPEVIGVNPATADLLDLCTGEFSVLSVIARMESTCPPGSRISQAVHAALENLSERGLIHFAARPLGVKVSDRERGAA